MISQYVLELFIEILYLVITTLMSLLCIAAVLEKRGILDEPRFYHFVGVIIVTYLSVTLLSFIPQEFRPPILVVFMVFTIYLFTLTATTIQYVEGESRTKNKDK